MAVAFGPTSCSSGLVPESKLSHSPEAQYGFVPKHSHHSGKNIALRAKKDLPPAPPREGSMVLPLWGVQERFLFFSEALFLLLDVCNNDSYVIRGMAWA